jgi:alcohol dehydrogenase
MRNYINKGVNMLQEFQYFMPARLHFGAGKVNQVGAIAKKYGKKAIIVTGQNSSRKTGALDKVTNSLKKEGIEYIIFDKIEPNPRTTTIDIGGELARKENCDMVIGLGGGSPMDASKVVALIAKDGRKTWNYVGTKNPPKSALPIICITTTSGTGSEADAYAVVTNPETKEKPGFGFDCTIPSESIIDPELSLQVPPRITASTGIDVFFHAIEAYTSKIASPISDMYAEKAIELIANNLPTAYKNGNDLNARQNMAIANTLAGIAIQLAGTGLIHAMAHPISGHYDCAHGEALTSVSIAIIKYNFEAEREKYIKMANLLGANIPKDDYNALAKVDKSLRDFYAKMNLNYDMLDLGVKEDNIDQLTEDAFSTMGFCIDVNAMTPNREMVKRLFNESIRTLVK